MLRTHGCCARARSCIETAATELTRLLRGRRWSMRCAPLQSTFYKIVDLTCTLPSRCTRCCPALRMHIPTIKRPLPKRPANPLPISPCHPQMPHNFHLSSTFETRCLALAIDQALRILDQSVQTAVSRAIGQRSFRAGYQDWYGRRAHAATRSAMQRSFLAFVQGGKPRGGGHTRKAHQPCAVR